MQKILIIEDDPDIRMALIDDFEQEGYEVDIAETGTKGLEKGENLDYDVILLDLMLPGISGIEICKELRRRGVGTPIIIVTAKSQDIDKVVGLEVGADDYVTKPFSLHELQARVKAVLRRSGNISFQNVKSVLTSGPFVLDAGKNILTIDGNPVRLTTIEFELFRYLMENNQKVLPRDVILDEVWGKEIYVTPRTVDTHIANLRKKIGDDQANSRWIIGIRGIGYKFVGE
ncbi:response regulator transcription factor [Bacteroidota bacterium]